MTASRTNRAIAKTALLALLLAFAPAVLAIDWPEVAVPAEAEGHFVSKHMVYNGLHMRVSQFEVDAPKKEVIAFYRDQWGDLMSETPHGVRTVIGRPEGEFFITVELTPIGNRTKGQIGVLQGPSKVPPPAGANFPKPARTVVKEDILYLDSPERMRTISMTNGLSVLQNHDFYRHILLGRGYRPLAEKRACSAASAACVAHYEKGKQHITVTLVKQKEKQGTSIVVLSAQ